MNWDDYRHFLAVARTGRLSSAGRALQVDHATVGRRIKALEEALGTNLFDRSPQGYSLTDAGQKLVNLAETMETSAIKAMSNIGGQANELSGTVRLGAPEGVASYMLADCAAAICRENPQLELQVVALPRTFSLTKREADIAIAVSAPSSGRLKYRKICDYTLHLYGTREYMEDSPPIESIPDLKKIKGIGYVPDMIYDKELDYIPLVAPDIRPFLTSTSLHVQIEATLAHGGVCILPDFIAKQHEQLQLVLPREISFTRSFFYIVHEDYAKLERIKTVSDAIIEHMKEKVRSREFDAG